MSKKALLRAIKHNRIQAVFSRFKKDKSGTPTDTPFYDLYGSPNLKRK